jgi:hypothetical protein
MSDTTTLRARPVSLFTIIFLFVLFAAALFVAHHFYHPASVAAYNAAPENLTKDLGWRATAAARREALQQTRAEQTKKLEGYGWVDRNAGVVHLPIERAMELTVQKYGAKK